MADEAHPSTTLPVSHCQIDHRSSAPPTQADRDGVDGVQELDGVHEDLRSEAKCTRATFLGEADWHSPRGQSPSQRDAAGLAGSLPGQNSCNCRSRSAAAKDWQGSARRVGAIFLPDLFCELVLDERDPKLPFAVVDGPKEARRGEEAELGNVILAASDVARRFGVRAGQTVVEARSLVASLAIRGLTGATIQKALGRVAEVALAFGTTASIHPCHPSLPLDAVFIDLTGTTHLRGGEEATLLELGSRVRALGHRVRLAIADGPNLARAVAAFGPSTETIVPPGKGGEAMKELPIEPLPLSRDHIARLHRLTPSRVGDGVPPAPPHAA